ncbi:MAG: FdrA, partial [Candidatus Cloacimonetes bacterium]|nr:FdrA [Candidatus Cloacimonadota bacterium]
LAFANAVPTGNIGIVSASGTGLQEVSVCIAQYGCGVSQAFGTGGRDGKAEIGGLMLLSCLDYLAEDPQTKVIVLIAKPPAEPVLIKLWARIAATSKPVIVNFMVPLAAPQLANMQYTTSLDKAALLACKASGASIPADAADDVAPFAIESNRKYIRGLYSGGTLCQEAVQFYKKNFGILPYSNVGDDDRFKMADAWKSMEDCFIDMGSDDYTVGRPHPMIDYSLRLKKITEEALDPEVAIIILDVVLGYGANSDPAAELVPVLNSLPPNLGVVCHVLGTKDDPQNSELQREKIASTGARVFHNHHQALSFAFQQLMACRSEQS